MSSAPLILVSAEAQPPRSADFLQLAKTKLAILVPRRFPLTDVLIALEEAYANILEHSFRSRPPGDVSVEVYLGDWGLTFLFTDSGLQGGRLKFWEESLDSRDLARKVAADGGGLGIRLIRKVMDLICYDVSSRGLNRLFLIKKFQEERGMKEDLIVELSVREKIGLIVLRGFVNMDTADFLSERLRDFTVREGVNRFMILAQELEYISSAGVAVFIDLYDRFEKAGGRICFVKLRPDVRRVLELVGFMAFFGDFDDEEEAQQYLD